MAVSDWLRLGRGARRESGPGDGLGLAAADLAELAEIERRLWIEEGAGNSAVVAATTQRLIARQVPARSVRPGPLQTLAVLGFADGTHLLVRALRSGDLGRLAVDVLGGHVLASSCVRQNDAVLLELTGTRTRRVVAAGLAH